MAWKKKWIKEVGKESVHEELFLVLNAAGSKIAKMNKVGQYNDKIMYQQWQGKLHENDKFCLLIYIDNCGWKHCGKKTEQL